MSAADRMRRYRNRRRRGGRVIRLEVDWDDLEALAERDLLEFEEADPDKIAEAVRAYLSENLGGV